MATTTRTLSYDSLCAHLQSKMIDSLGYTKERALEEAAKYAGIFYEAFSNES
jgi:hypothetical protein